MSWLFDIYDGFARLFGGGAVVLTLIFLLAAALWALIIERYWYFLFVHPDVLENALSIWRRRASGPLFLAQRARRHILIDVGAQMAHSITLIRSLMSVIFLLGLLGSMSGVMQTLDALTFSGSDDTHALAYGIAAAAIPVVTALAVVITGVLFSQELAQRVQRESRLLRDQMRRG
ncbi:MAG TPA: MotA/TolQ/ExbB proton channel family protein [Gammaproteobacteria bacterium]|nr:MotA/TolQ/ExbB proton channel family protein [Gammaproteobacteria bacterium]